jgi:SP family general alpha glucoside:H+ symporter-like MFS transporter
MAGLLGSYVSVTMEVVANTNGLFFAGKFINGFVVGVLAAVCPTYLGEIVPLALRGLLTAMIAFAYALAPLTAAVIVNFTGTKTNAWAYRTVFCAQYGFCVVSTIFAPFMPESPWWLASKGSDEKALKSLRRLGCHTDIEAVRKLALIKVTLEEIRRETDGVTYLECFRVSNLRRTIISIAPLTIQALGGVIFIAGYFVYYAELAGYSSAAAFKLYVIFQLISMCGNVVSWFIIDRVGRRGLTLYGTAGLTVILMLAGGLATAGKASDIKGCFSMMMIYAFVYNCTIGATGYTLLTEIATSRLRVKTIAIGIALQNIIYMILGIVLPYLFNPNYLNLGAKVRHRLSYFFTTLPIPPSTRYRANMVYS